MLHDEPAARQPTHGRINEHDAAPIVVPDFVEPPRLSSIPAKPHAKITTGFTEAGDPHLDLGLASLPGKSGIDLVQWQRTATCLAPINDVAAWGRVMETFIRQPEVNSSNILRADILLDERIDSASLSQASGSIGNIPRGIPTRRIPRWTPTRRILRRLLPRRPTGNPELEQLCTFYEDRGHDGKVKGSLVVYTPVIGPECLDGSTPPTSESLHAWLAASRSPSGQDEMPFYHPPLLALAFAYVGSDKRDSGGTGASLPHLSISVVPFPSTQPSPLSERLLRISTTLLTTLHRHIWGQSHSYKPRATHDQLVPKALFQDVYLNLKHRWGEYLVREWRENTPAEKHVHEDLGVAAWLMCFWKVRGVGAVAAGAEGGEIGLNDRPWLIDSAAWPRPRGGFVDVGCGNGLLVWLLNNEGYEGFGFDLRERKSWELFGQTVAVEQNYASSPRPASGPADLRVHTLNALESIWRGYTRDSSSSPLPDLFPQHCFLIGNHADELTPLLPFLASYAVGPSCAGMLNIPCCKWKLDGTRFTGGKFKEALGLTGDEDNRAKREVRDEMQAIALAYVSHLHLLAGWHVEKEALRIPSTRNWAVVGVKRVDQGCPSSDRWAQRDGKVREMLDQARGKWKAREEAATVRREHNGSPVPLIHEGEDEHNVDEDIIDATPACYAP
ncbi:DUF1613-domain-containing protein [Jaminaea rosea]|uniref:tRNA (uracil-O(2)-)-methyltransferase n=1 Tax=Jaminaea rosea TaxID=1569628 RepID=A0A316UGN4_9BASI|nr:DUF1613-domain-containing protein [Jaminaea rosea]PWN24422.1 DUF1613-domain-containing protein [Jaminaea rosea]